MAVVRCSLRAGAGLWLAAALLAGATMVADVASAQPINGRARWCVTFPQGGTYDCAYHSLEQCMAAASGVSNQCSLNPWYDKRLDVYPRPRSPYWPFF
jgi:uncharacterized protein DUF3551